MQEYRYKFYLNALHSIQIEGVKGELHPHTWEITVDLFKQNNGFVTFSEVEKMVDELLNPFQDQNMNTISPFDAINPTLENVSIYFHEILETLFIQNGFLMSRMEVSETPARSFIIDIKNGTINEPVKSHNTINDMKIIETEAEKLLREKTGKFNVSGLIEKTIKHANDIEISEVIEGKDSFKYSPEKTREIAKIIDIETEHTLKRPIKKQNNWMWYIIFAILIILLAVVFYLKG